MSTSPRRKVIEAIREQITSGRYTAGSRLPTELELADELAVARGTVRSALRELAETGVVELRRKIGCFVAEHNPLQPRHPHRLAAFVVPSMPGRHSMYGRLLEGLEQAAFAADCDLSFFNLAQQPVGLKSKFCEKNHRSMIYYQSKKRCMMAAKFVILDRDTPMMLPPDLRDWISEDSMVHFIVDAVEALEIKGFGINERGSGSAQYPPQMMLSLLI